MLKFLPSLKYAKPGFITQILSAAADNAKKEKNKAVFVRVVGWE
jgi:hypothetical protein